MRDTDPGDARSGTALGAYVTRGVFMNLAALHGFAAFPGFSPAQPAALAEFLNDDGLTLLGIDYLLIETARLPAGYPALGGDAELDASLIEPTQLRPRAFVAPRWVRVLDAPAVLEIAHGEPDPGRVVLLGEGNPAPASAANAPPGPCVARADRPERVELRCTSATGGYATLLDSMAAGWTATVDGAPTRIETADALFRTVRVGPGSHEVLFTYQTPLLRLGAAIAVAGWGAWIAVLALARRRRRMPSA